jgi:hypothetical protein
LVYYKDCVEERSTEFPRWYNKSMDEKRALFKAELLIEGDSQFELMGEPLHLFFEKDMSHLSVKDPVYIGENYIPKSVRQAIGKKAPFDSGHLLTSFFIDEEKSIVYLVLDLFIEEGTQVHLMLNEFAFLGFEWRKWLDQEERRDLVHVFQKR